MRPSVFLMLLLPIALLSNPKGHQVAHGSSTIKSTGNHLEVTASDRAVLHWNEFSIGKDETTTFIQPGPNSIVLNRVMGKSISELQGALGANGRVVLVNPNGVVITRTGVVDTAAFIASSLDVFEDSFTKNSEIQFVGKNKKGVINFGKISAFDGDVALIGFFSENHGTIEAKNGSVSIIGSEEVFLKPKNAKYFTIRTKNIDQDKLANEGNPYAEAINLNRDDDALIPTTKDGQTYLVSRAVVSGEIYARKKDTPLVSILADEVLVDENALISSQGLNKGGVIYLGGSFQGKDPNIANASYTQVASGAFLDATAIEAGDGGEVIVWSDGQACFQGTADVSANISGNGGLVEISGKKGFYFSGKTLRLGKNGEDGKLLFDPDADVVIHQDHYYKGAFHNKKWIPTDNKSYIEIGNHFTAGTLLFELSQGDVTIQTEGSGFPDAGGNIIVNDDLVYHLLPGHDLIFKTKGDFTLNASLVNTGQGDIIIDSCHNLLLDASNSNKDLVLSAEVGRVWIKNVYNDLKLIGGKYSPAIIGTYKRAKPGIGQVQIDTIGHDLVLKGGESSSGFAMIGTYMSSSTMGDISIDKIGNDLLLEADKGFCQIGHGQIIQEGELSGNITISHIGHNAKLVSSQRAKAHIGHGLEGEHSYDQTGNIALEFIGNDLSLFANEKFTQIGHSNQTGCNGSKKGDLFVNAKNDINLISGKTVEGYSLIGHGGLGGNFLNASLTGSVIVNASRDISLKGADIEYEGSNGFTAIGFALQSVTTNAPIHLCAPTFSINAKNDVIIQSGNSSDAVIGAYLPLDKDAFSLEIRQLQLNAGNTLQVKGYSGEIEGVYSEAVLGFRCDPNVSIEQYKQRLGLLIYGEEGVIVQGGATAFGEHPAFIRGLERWDRSIITSENDILLLAKDHGEAGIFHNGPLEVFSKVGSIEILSAEENDAFIEISGNTLDLLSSEKIILKEGELPSGKINIKIDPSTISPTIFHAGLLYREKEGIENPVKTISITETNFDQAEDLHCIKSTPDLIFLGTFCTESAPKYSLLCNSQLASSYYQDSTIQVTYEANILVSEFLFRLTPTLEYLGYKERFSLYFDDIAQGMPQQKNYYIRRPYLFLKGIYQEPLFW